MRASDTFNIRFLFDASGHMQLRLQVAINNPITFFSDQNTIKHKRITYVTRPDKRDLKSLGPIRATGKELRGDHYNVLHLTVLLQLTRTSASFKVEA